MGTKKAASPKATAHLTWLRLEWVESHETYAANVPGGVLVKSTAIGTPAFLPMMAVIATEAGHGALVSTMQGQAEQWFRIFERLAGHLTK